MRSSVLEDLRRLRRELLIQRLREPSLRKGVGILYTLYNSIMNACLSALDEKS